jgi:hypothetical protein
MRLFSHKIYIDKLYNKMTFTHISSFSLLVLLGVFTPTVLGWGVLVQTQPPATKLAFLHGNIPEDILQARQSESTQSSDHHYFDPLTGEALRWNDYDAHSRPAMLGSKTFKPLRMEPSQQVLAGTDCGENYYFDPVAGEALCWAG